MFGEGDLGAPGHAGSVCEWQLSDSTHGLLAQVLVCLESGGMTQTLLVTSSDEILTNLLLLTALTVL